jgi:lysozyme family protein
MPIELTDRLRQEYEDLFNTCQISPARQAAVEKALESIVRNRSRYEAVGGPLGIPWYFIGAIHNMESSQNFKKHLHNGDPLTARTVHVPAGRPAAGQPPFTWEESAMDALKMKRLDTITDWTAPAILFQMERYNGFGYRNNHPEVLSPYLWSFSNHYAKGKFVKDGVFDPDAISDQCGAAVLLRRMVETGVISKDAGGAPSPGFDPATVNAIAAFGPLVVFSETQFSPTAKTLQIALNKLPGIFLRDDGVPGSRTSDAFRKVTGRFLSGDPRGT